MPNYYYIFGLVVCAIIAIFVLSWCLISKKPSIRNYYPGISDVKDIYYLDDGFGNCFSPYCPECKKKTMVIIRPGKVQCGNCG